MAPPVNVVKFIEEVRYWDFLYKKAHPKFKDTTLKENRWSSIAAKFHLRDGERARHKWKNLIDTYRKEKKKLGDDAFDDESGKRNKRWRWYNIMDSILKYENVEVSDVTSPHPEPPGVDICEPMILIKEEPANENPFPSDDESNCNNKRNSNLEYTVPGDPPVFQQGNILESSAETSELHNGETSVKRKSRDKVMVLDSVTGFSVEDRYGEGQSAEEADERYLYGMSLIKRFQSLSGRSFAQIRFKIEQFLFENQDLV